MMNHLEHQSGHKTVPPQTKELTTIPGRSCTIASCRHVPQKLKWTMDEKAYLRQAMTDDASLKVMARALGRTSTAINKALSRFNIRPASEMKTQIDRRRPCTPHVHQGRKCKTLNSEVFKRRPPANPWCWISFEGMIAWLAHCGVTVVPLARTSDVAPATVLYVLNDGQTKKCVSTSQVLMFANQRRLALKLPPFYVTSLTER